MGYFSRLATDVEELLCEGATVAEISVKLNISEAQVQEYIKQLESADRDPWEWVTV
jgi:DNA-binding NarL/FixJ family response regulator